MRRLRPNADAIAPRDPGLRAAGKLARTKLRMAV
jgi:hypothetical protein